MKHGKKHILQKKFSVFFQFSSVYLVENAFFRSSAHKSLTLDFFKENMTLFFTRLMSYKDDKTFYNEWNPYPVFNIDMMTSLLKFFVAWQLVIIVIFNCCHKESVNLLTTILIKAPSKRFGFTDHA